MCSFQSRENHGIFFFAMKKNIFPMGGAPYSACTGVGLDTLSIIVERFFA
jgi:hypothetical protein